MHIKERGFEVGCLFFIAVGILLAGYDFLYFRTLWLDEAKLALNIVNRSYLGLLQPLDNNQVTPLGFLLVVKFFGSLFDYTDWSLRIFPLTCFLASIPLFFRLNLYLTNNRKFALYACTLFSLSRVLILYAGEFKQYMTDVFFALALAVCTFRFLATKDKSGTLLLTIVGVVSIWFSNVAVVMLFSLGMFVLLKTLLTSRQDFARLLVPFTGWIVSFLLYHIFFIYDHPTKEAMTVYWDDAFLPHNVFSALFFTSLFSKVEMLASLIEFGNRYYLPLWISISGIVFGLFKKKRALVWITIVPVCVHLGLSYFKLYPFYPRLILYLLPLTLILFAFGSYHFFMLIRKTVHIPRPVLLLFVALLTFRLFLNIPHQKQELKKSFAYIQAHHQPEDRVFVYYASTSVLLFYKDDYPFLNNEDSLAFSRPSREDREEYDRLISALEPGSYWLIFSHVYTNPQQYDLDEKQYMLQQFQNHGYNFVDEEHYPGASVYKVRK